MAKSKKVLFVFLAAVLLLGGVGFLVGFIGTKAKENPQTIETYVYDFDKVSVSMHMDMAEIIDKLGEPNDYFETESCAFQGKDKVYTYGSVVIKTYPKEGKDLVYSLELKDDTVETKEKIRIGSSKDKVISCYGEPSKSTGYSMMYEKKDSMLVFIMEDGETIDSIVYQAIL